MHVQLHPKVSEKHKNNNIIINSYNLKLIMHSLIVLLYIIQICRWVL